MQGKLFFRIKNDDRVRFFFTRMRKKQVHIKIHSKMHKGIEYIFVLTILFVVEIWHVFLFLFWQPVLWGGSQRKVTHRSLYMQVLFAFLIFVHLFKYTSSNKLRYHKLSGTKRALCEIPRILDINEVSSLNKTVWIKCNET